VDLVDKALAFEKADRWATAALMRAGIESLFGQLFARAPGPADLAPLLGHEGSAVIKPQMQTAAMAPTESASRKLAEDSAGAPSSTLSQEPAADSEARAPGGTLASGRHPANEDRATGTSTANPVSNEVPGSMAIPKTKERGLLVVGGLVGAVVLGAGLGSAAQHPLLRPPLRIPSRARRRLRRHRHPLPPRALPSSPPKERPVRLRHQARVRQATQELRPRRCRPLGRVAPRRRRKQEPRHEPPPHPARPPARRSATPRSGRMIRARRT
jgi:hypothetical protein